MHGGAHQQRVERVEVDEAVDVERGQARLVLVERRRRRLDVDRVLAARAGPERGHRRAPGPASLSSVARARKKSASLRARRRRVVARGSRRGSCPAGSRGSARTGRPRETSSSVWCFVPRARSTSTRSPGSIERSSAVCESTSSAARIGLQRRHGAGGRAVDEERVRERRHPLEARRVDRRQRPPRPGCSGPISTEFSSLETTGVTARHPGDLELGGEARRMRTAGSARSGVTRRSEPTTNLESAAFARVVGGGEHREADPEGDHQADAGDPRGERPRSVAAGCGSSVPPITASRSAAAAGSGSRDVSASKTRTASSMPPSHATAARAAGTTAATPLRPPTPTRSAASKARGAQGEHLGDRGRRQQRDVEPPAAPRGRASQRHLRALLADLATQRATAGDVERERRGEHPDRRPRSAPDATRSPPAASKQRVAARGSPSPTGSRAATPSDRRRRSRTRASGRASIRSR